MDFWTEEQLRSIDRMLNPRSIAVVGASAKEGGYGGRFLNAVMRAKDRVRIYAVNPKYDEINGVRSYASVADLPEAPDLVGIVVPHQMVRGVLEECQTKRAGSAIVISAGFAERGTDAGFSMQHWLSEFGRKSGIRIAGPNCLGIANVRQNIWATATSRSLNGLTGSIALVCQSGATAFGPFLLRAVDAGIGLGYIISTGNEADLDFCDFARYLLDDPDTRVIAGFVEGFKDVRKFITVAELAAERGKPIVLIKIGRSEAGAQAARSHTAALTGADALYESVFKQYGVIRVQDYDELLEVANLLAESKKPKKRGVSVVSNSGGISSLTADMLGVAGLKLPPLSERASKGINAILKDFGWAANPADITGFARRDEFLPIADYMISEPEVGTLVVASVGAGTQLDNVITLRQRTDKNVVYFFTGSREDKKVLDKLKAAKIPIFYSPEKLARGLRCFLDYHAWRDERLAFGASRTPLPTLTSVQHQALEDVRMYGRTTLSEKESKRLLASWGISGPRELPARSSSGAVEAARELGYPVVIKIDTPDIPHKTEAGIVRLNLRNGAEVRRAYEEIMANAKKNAPSAKIAGVLVQEMVTAGVEVIVGVKHDAQLGPMLLFGSGGVMVEVYNDVALRHCPITLSEAHKMIGEVKGAQLLRGFRGKPLADIDALADVLVRVSQLVVHFDGGLAELEINPVIVLPKGAGVKAVDALIVLHHDAHIDRVNA